MSRSFTELSIDKNWGGNVGTAQTGTFLNGWARRTAAGGSISVASPILTTSAPALGDQALVDYYVPANPGARVEMDVFARLVSGQAGLFVDAVNRDSTFSQREKVMLETALVGTSNDWRRYRVGYTMPLKSDSPFLRIALGASSSAAGDARWHSPVIRTTWGYGPQLCIARGLLRCQTGTPQLHPNFPSFGVSALSFNGSNLVTVSLDREIMSTPSIRPLVLCSGTNDNPWPAVAGQVASGNPGTFQIQWAASGAFVNVAAATVYAMFAVYL
jgi:hypothetical protein